MIDTDLLLAWIDEHSEHPVPLVGAIYAGLAARIRRGDFNTESSEVR